MHPIADKAEIAVIFRRRPRASSGDHNSFEAAESDDILIQLSRQRDKKSEMHRDPLAALERASAAMAAV
jgi:hypothetical protein